MDSIYFIVPFFGPTMKKQRKQKRRDCWYQCNSGPPLTEVNLGVHGHPVPNWGVTFIKVSSE